MKQLTVISGKGGTGKTTLTSAFAALAENATIADCDVDAANMHLLLQPEIIKTYDFTALPTANIHLEQCTGCGICVDNCRFGAIKEGFEIDPYICEGCGVCEYVCPADAVTMEYNKCGEAYESKTRFGPLVHAKLGIGEEAGGKLVTLVREIAEEVGPKNNCDTIIIDGPPGTGCSVIAALTGVDIALVVTEPTVAGIHDLKRVMEVTEHFEIPSLVCINKSDINDNKRREIEKFCTQKGIKIAGEIPYDTTPTEAMVEGKTIVEYTDNSFAKCVIEVWEEVKEEMQS
ncbi:MAG: cobyrinic acid ac-diamide synthase [Methanohalophilus sp. T328-1]|jgi:MinD superfamily P-loop ATPase|uniref:MinD superfamily P-loop ATPase n=1 Tax=Methanohalophilus euhalobius TaxID=51203 RepID=A0A285G031_9EURY|nr:MULTISPECIES: ATP-binding protein [Methanohalophilus]KXS40227.1 MAG: cobyrinic acid ac-diamide synthase [Methanohalophilus sp. T328-1]RSD34730.1 MAG: cobyrinic acid ac-diamide synthase [Methanohalophilus sp.]OBZ34605.1 MAG: (4Fe-4S)-binding protein [Methanohalophilus sp. DAL1]ODV50265.1 MAG: cobyrinic acid ac-diamide synthase [Methanohalophilus sp. 2-GBenrich]TCL11672.1 MinD superfamily P-loop ATPase [Methanohalophilus euhalobius]